MLALGVSVLSVPAAGASSASTATVTYKFTTSRVAWTGSRAVIAATDSHGDLYYFWQAAGSTTWHKQVVAQATTGVSFSNPSIAWTGQAVIIVALEASNSVVYFSPAAGGTWTKPQPVFSYGSDWRAPTVTGVPGGGAIVDARTTTGKLYSTEFPPGGSGWTGGVVSYGISGPSSVITCYDSLADQYLGLIAATSGNALDFWWEYLGSGDWNQETIASLGVGVSFTSASITATNNTLLVAASTSTGTLYVFSQAIGGSGWTAQTVSSAVGTSSHPVIASFERLSVVLRTYVVIAETSPKGQLDFWWQPAGASTWDQETIAKASKDAVYSSPDLSITGTSVLAAALNTKPGDVLSWYQSFGTTPWHEQLVAKG